MSTEHEKIAATVQESLTAFARLREHMHGDGPGAVVDALNLMSEGELRQILFALVVTTDHAAGDERG